MNISEDELYEKVTSHTGVDRSRLEQLIHLDDDGPRISVPGLKLGENLAERARSVAQILTVTRAFGIDESETSLEIIRAECERLKVYDSANFSTQMRALSGYVINGAGQNRRLRVSGQAVSRHSPGWWTACWEIREPSRPSSPARLRRRGDAN